MAFDRIGPDYERFRKIVHGRIRENLRRYISHGEMIGRRGKDLISIPIPEIDIPRFEKDPRKDIGVGQGKGGVGDLLGKGKQERGAGAGDLPGEHMLEVDVTLEDLAQLLGEELELPRIEPKGKKNIQNYHNRYTTIRRVGPESLRHFKRTYKQALKRQIISGQYNPEEPRIVPIHEDRFYKSWKRVPLPESSAVVFYMMDVSGSMGDEQKEIVRTESFWIDIWLRSHYKNLEVAYLIHDAEAREVDREAFYGTKESGGTKISSAYKLFADMIDKKYNPDDWNIYGFHFSDGDNWSEDNDDCISLLEQRILSRVSLFCYGQVKPVQSSD